MSAPVLPAGELIPAGPPGALLVRQAAAGDRDALTRMFERCTPATRYHRFHGPVQAIPRSYLAEALSGSPFHHALVGCPYIPASPAAYAGETVALASCRLVAEGAAELGLLIEDGWQRRGLGTRLVHDLVTHAARSGVREVEAQLLAEQAWIGGLLRPYGSGRVHSARDGVLTVTVRLDPCGIAGM
ncbi:MAG TPA: GNAT family N-acetyltransferase [Trebonia sp.]